MSDISDLKASVLEQAHEKGRLLLAEATEKIEQEAKEREAQLVRQKLGQREQQLKEISRRSQRDIQQLENQKRQSTLVIKQRVLRELFEEAYAQMVAWSLAEEEHFLKSALAKYPEEELTLTFGALSAEKFSSNQLEDLKKAFPQVHFSDQSIAGQAGFVLSQGRVDDSYLYRDLLDSVWQEESYRLAQDIFKDQAE
ncbi:V-type ATP synthase, subunit E [Streptococcus sanguinis SK1 = NCTC 7863]|jgi:V-type sodium ATPase, subunit E, putative|uniref:V-type sodium ATP synthase, subunit E family protein n=1 Tax=Streptococcus sanguinis SK405 TaxID=888817 RepID=A0ABC9PFN4_STRSA|nr:hypothetical protein [Streptococcus sanguinis]EGC24593.1 V-type sodium ATP synthase, subunit E family protein [Streptococcus sanguinis SK405]EGF06414.1 V-type ATP synthase, subunit E [Streptococcus sanguinis SK1 = NCTC 7863]MBZ2075371.1 hypothetical protein [Streptococcus sanguinis]MCY7013886.1 hypothetical protein [Streptococcus sanguinis]RSI24202.1 V-type proton ATPase subunit E [Streptococcus sanguinis]